MIENKRHSVRLSVAVDEGEYAELKRLGAKLGLPAAWMIRRAMLEFVARHRDTVEANLPLRRPEAHPARNKKVRRWYDQ